MKGKLMLWIDQHGRKFWSHTIAELAEQADSPKGRRAVQYQDKKDGRTVRNGIIIGQQWFTGYIPYEVEA